MDRQKSELQAQLSVGNGVESSGLGKEMESKAKEEEERYRYL